MIDPSAPTTALKGVGEKIAEALARRQIRCVADLIFFFPIGYQDQRRQKSLATLQAGDEVTVTGVVARVRRRRRRRRPMVEIELADEAGDVRLSCVWFGKVANSAAAYPAGSRIQVWGKARARQGRLQMAHPEVWSEGPGRLHPRYREVAGVPPRTLRKLCAQACARAVDGIEGALPAQVAEDLGLLPLTDALRVIHLVDVDLDDGQADALTASTHPAHRRLLFDAIFALQIAVAHRRQRWRQARAWRCALGGADRIQVEAALPFELTAAQRRVAGEILADLGRSRPMHRLLQGDVGSGKTAVAFVAAAAAMSSGGQVALMAPTEVLAAQHFDRLRRLCAEIDVESALVTASLAAAERAALRDRATRGEIDLLVGTHALLDARLELPRLALAIIDEQHRFGVAQRAHLGRRSTARAPHLLVMSATPIPRSLALTVYGDLDLSLLDELPPGRSPVATEVSFQRGRLVRGSAAFAAISLALRRGERVFVVCPLVEASQKLDISDAQSAARRLTQTFGAEFGVGLVHGRQHPTDRAAQIEAFRRGGTRLLVATTVIEVGVDVPEATTMVVEHAERFGLAQLHQLRGRVGRRGGARGRCILLCGAERESDAARRLAVLEGQQDGFAIAEADLAQRGPGELLGRRQTGFGFVTALDRRDQLAMIAEARRCARALLDQDPDLAKPGHAGARRALACHASDLPGNAG